MRMRGSRHVGAVAVLVAAWFGAIVPARAEGARSLAGEMVGQWELSTAERSKTCVVTLRGDGPNTAMKLELEKGCAEALPFTREITAWSIKGLDIVRLQDASGQSVIDVTETRSSGQATSRRNSSQDITSAALAVDVVMK